MRKILRQYRIMGQGDSARDFDASEGMKNAGILDVFPIFSYCTIGTKDLPKPAVPIVRCCLNSFRPELRQNALSSLLGGKPSGVICLFWHNSFSESF